MVVVCGGCSPDEDDISLSAVLPDLCAEEQVSAQAYLHHGLEAGLEDGQGVAIPCCNARLINVHHNHLNILHPQHRAQGVER